MNKGLKTLIAVTLAVFLSACAMPQTKEGQGTALGAGIGAGVGAITGAILGQGKGALIGAGIGAAAGGLAGNRIGHEMDQQQAALQQQLANERAVEIQRENNLLRLTFHSDMTFALNSATPSPGAANDLQRVAQVLNQYPQTRIQIAGYTDSTGSEQYNQQLSERRANAVKNILLGHGVAPGRLTTVGFGEASPVATNATAAGRQANRRVVITIIPMQAAG